MLLVAGWAHRGRARAGDRPLRQPLGAAARTGTGRWSPPARTSTRVPDGGRYDGALGTVLGLELAADLGAAPSPGGCRAALLVCAAEEAPRFGAGTVGSRQLVGSLAPERAGAAARRRRGHGAAGAGRPSCATPRTCRGSSRRWIAGAPTPRSTSPSAASCASSASSPASPRRAGSRSPSPAGRPLRRGLDGDRRDALAGAAEIVLAIERAAGDEPAETVATVGDADGLSGRGQRDPGRGPARRRHARHRPRVARSAARPRCSATRARSATGAASTVQHRADPRRRAGRARPASGRAALATARDAGDPGTHEPGRGPGTTPSTSPRWRRRCWCSCRCTAARATRPRRAPIWMKSSKPPAWLRMLWRTPALDSGVQVVKNPHASGSSDEELGTAALPRWLS